MKYTTEPWKKNGLSVVAHNRGIICHCPTPQLGGVFECHSNTLLIAAAPDLLAASETIAKIISEQMYSEFFERNLNYCLKTELLPAITRAKGETEHANEPE